MLTKTCRFCESAHIIRQTTNYNFEQPDLIVPFGLGGRAAQVRVEEYLNSGIRKLTRFFADAIARIDLNPIYLPCWVFDADMVVAWSWTNAPAHGKHPVLLSDVLQLAVPTPAHSLFEDAESYDLRRGVDYDARLLADIPARLYDADMTEASLAVRGKLGRLAIEQAGTSIRLNRPSGYGNNNDPGRLRMNASTQFLTYRLALVPAWLGRLVEVDNDWRHVLVNGQTGRVALGKLNKVR